MHELVITAVGPDRPGLVDELTGKLHEQGANLADSRMVNLRGQFAVILLAEVPDTVQSDLPRLLREVGEKIGLSVSVSAAPPAGTAAAKGGVAGIPGVPYRLRTYAMDQPGIVHRITHLLHRHGVNIEELQTRLESGSVSGTPLFTMDLRMTVPTNVQVKTLRRDLEALCDSLNCDVEVQPA